MWNVTFQFVAVSIIKWCQIKKYNSQTIPQRILWMIKFCLICLSCTENRCRLLQNSVGADTMRMYVCISQTLHDLYWECPLNNTPNKCSDMLKYVGFSPPASASGPFPTGLSPPRCIFPNKKLLPETCQITHIARVYLNTLHVSDNADIMKKHDDW